MRAQLDSLYSKANSLPCLTIYSREIVKAFYITTGDGGTHSILRPKLNFSRAIHARFGYIKSND